MGKFKFDERVLVKIWEYTTLEIEADSKEEAIEKLNNFYDDFSSVNYCDKLNEYGITKETPILDDYAERENSVVEVYDIESEEFIITI